METEGPGRRGVAAVELALLLPMLCMMALMMLDYARVIRDAIRLADAARDGALYLADGQVASASGYPDVSSAVLDGLGGSGPTPTVEARWGTEEGLEYVEVTVRSTFRTLFRYPGIPAEVPLVRAVRMPVLAP